ncbi:hypothetical protein PMI31_01164 [Pseudomonas sp. GM55]|nr:hypothetical protein PMI31_01164 [Pseudomonas sp. GM55]
MKASLPHKQKGAAIPLPNLPATLTASTSLQF